MRKLLLAVSILVLIAGCKTKQETAQPEPASDSLWQAPQPGVDDRGKYDSLKQELDKRRKNKQ